MFGTINLETYFDQITDQGWVIFNVNINFANKLRDCLNVLKTEQGLIPSALAHAHIEKNIRNDFIHWIENDSMEVSGSGMMDACVAERMKSEKNSET